MNEIKLTQHPIIEHRLVEMGRDVSERIDALNIENQVATDETVKKLKDLRAELNKEAKEFEEQRKMVKEAILSPYNDFEGVYKSEIIDKYKNADALLKDKINTFEMKIKSDKRNNLIAYFNELCTVEKIDWLSFDRLNIEVNLSTTEKKYKEQILEEIERIKDDLNLINSDKYAAEILVEYKKTLKASQAIQSVRARKENERIEAERIRDKIIESRVRQLLGISFVFHDLTKTYNYIHDESVMVKISDIENLTTDEWGKVFAELKEKTKTEVLDAPKENPTQPDAKNESTNPVENKKEIFVATFKVSGTFAELMMLKSFLVENNFNYENIK